MQTVDVPRAYDVIAGTFFAQRSTDLREKKYLDRALMGVQRGDKVLDFGCGTGRPIGEYLVRQGYEVTGVDGSAGMLALARTTIPSAQLIQARLEDVELSEVFAAAVVWDSLFHVDRSFHAGVYAKLARWIRPGGGLLLTSGGSEDPGFTDQMHGETFFYSSWKPDDVVRLLEIAGFAVEQCEVDQPESRGHVVIVARRKSA
ncbi:MAG: class I SAM-dependent methyltransferase [Opitutus sp.]